MSSRRPVAAIVAVLLMLLLPAASPLAAQGGGEVVARGLNAPRSMVWDTATGSLIVAEAGTGGPNPVIASLGPGMAGETGRIVAIDPDGVITPIVTGLISVAFRGGSEINGIHGLALDGQTLYGVLDGSGPSTDGYGWVIAIDLATGQRTDIANLVDFEIAFNPDPPDVESNPYAVTIAPSGDLLVADAAANSVLRVTVSGEVELVAVIPPLPGIAPNPARGGAREIDPVPTGIAVDCDGVAYVSTLTGFPFLHGTAGVYRIGTDGTVDLYAGGLTTLTGLTLGPDGRLYAIEMSQGFATDQIPPGFIPSSGRVVRLAEAGVETVVDGLNFPTGIAFSPDGDLFVAVDGSFVAPGAGQIVRWRGVAMPWGGSQP